MFQAVYTLRAADVGHDPARLARVVWDNTLRLFPLPDFAQRFGLPPAPVPRSLTVGPAGGRRGGDDADTKVAPAAPSDGPAVTATVGAEPTQTAAKAKPKKARVQ